MKYTYLSLILLLIFSCTPKKEEEAKKQKEENFTGAMNEVKLITLDPGHFHSGLVQKSMYEQIDPKVHVYAPKGPELEDHLNRIESYNSRTDNPTRWETIVYSGDDFFERMLEEQNGNVVMLAGNNARKSEYILGSLNVGINVLADKPMIIKPDQYGDLTEAFKIAEDKGLLLCDIMTERYEITTILQKEFSKEKELFGDILPGSHEDPSITKESVHHFFKYVSGKPLVRPGWFFDVDQQGEAIVDVTTHLIDLVMWECFTEEPISYNEDIELISAKRWSTEMKKDQFQRVTGLEKYPEFLKKDIDNEGNLQVYANGAINFKLRGIHSKVSVKWNYEAPEGAKDTHYSIMKGSGANLIIEQGQVEGYKPVLYIENTSNKSRDEFLSSIKKSVEKISKKYPGIQLSKAGERWKIDVPEKYRIGHEAHFAQVTEKYLQYLVDGSLPKWEQTNMLTKYKLTTEAFKLAHQ